MTLFISDDRLQSSADDIAHLNTPNQSRGRIDPRFVVLHDTCGYGHGRGSMSWFMKKSARVSAHLLIAEDGSITQFAAFDRATWHAGKSQWRGVSGKDRKSVV